MKKAPVNLIPGGGFARVVLCILAAGLSSANTKAGTFPREAVSISIRGRVLNQDSQPQRGAEVQLSALRSSYSTWVDEPSPEPADTVGTAVDGGFEIRVPKMGLWLVRVRAAGYQAQTFLLLALLEDRSLPPVTLRKVRVVRVQVLDPRGMPVDGAWVLPPPTGESASRYGPDSWRPEEPRQRTDHRGEAWVPVPRGSETGALWTVEHPAFTTMPLELAEDFVSIRLTPEVQSPGEVQLITGPTGTPWTAGALIIQVGRRVPVALVPESGHAKIPNIERDRPQLQFLSAAGGRPALLRMAPGEREGTYRAQLPKPSAVHGQVVDAETEKGIPGVFVWLEDDPGVSTRSDQEGFFALPRPLASHLRIGLDSEGYQPSFQSIVSRPGRPAVMKLRPAGRLIVAVKDEAGRAVSEIEPRLRLLPWGGPAGPGAQPRFRSNFSSDLGELTLRKLLPMTSHELTVRAPGYTTGVYRWTAQAGAGPRAVLTLEPEHRLKGAVVTLKGDPIPRAEVVVIPSVGAARRRKAALGTSFPASVLASEETGRDGGFEIGELPRGPFDLIVRKRGFGPGVVAGISFDPGIRGRTLDLIHLSPTIEMHGRVVSDAGDGVEGARVFVVYRVDRPGGGGSEVPRGRGRPADITDTEGGFSLSDLEEGASFTLGVWKEGFVPKKVESMIPSSGETLRVQLSAGAKLEGTVLDHLGSPLSGAKVEISKAGGLSGTRLVTLYGSRPGATTSADGRFEMSGLLSGPAVVVVRAKGHGRKVLRDLRLTAEHGLNISVQLRAGLQIRGIALGDDGHPVAGAVVQSGGERTHTDVEGRFELDGFPEGGARIVALHPTHGAAQKFVNPGAGERDVELIFRPSASVGGVVLDYRRQPVAGAEVWLDTGLGAPSRQIAGSTGEFLFENIPVVPSWVLRARGADSAFVEKKFRPETGPGLEVTLILGATCRVRGKVYPVGSSEAVEIFANTPGGATLEGIVLNGSEYLVEGLSEGTWLVVARSEGGLRGEARVECDGKNGEIRRDLELGEGEALAIVALFQGAPLAGASVKVENDAGFVVGGGRTDRRGTFLASGLPPGRYQVKVRSPDRTLLTESATTLPGSGRLELVLRRDPGPR